MPASEFTRNFGRHRMMAQRETVAVSSHGLVTGYFVGPEEYEAFWRLQAQRRSFTTVELAPEKASAIGEAQMDERHAQSDELMGSEWGGALAGPQPEAGTGYLLRTFATELRVIPRVHNLDRQLK